MQKGLVHKKVVLRSAIASIVYIAVWLAATTVAHLIYTLVNGTGGVVLIIAAGLSALMGTIIAFEAVEKYLAGYSKMFVFSVFVILLGCCSCLAVTMYLPEEKYIELITFLFSSGVSIYISHANLVKQERFY